MLRFNEREYVELKAIGVSYGVDICERGRLAPLLRRLVLNNGAAEKDRLPDASDLSYQANRIGNNINQLVRLAHGKSKRFPGRSIIIEIERANVLLDQLVRLVIEKQKQ